MSQGFDWDLSGLAKADAVEGAMAARAQMRKTHASPVPTPLGGAVDSERGSGSDSKGEEEEVIVSLAVSWMMAVKSTCLQPTDEIFPFCNITSRGFYGLSWVLCLCAAVGSWIRTIWYEPQLMDWFAWSVWATVALSELLFIAIRIQGRFLFITNPETYQEHSPSDLIEAFGNRVPFRNWCHAVTVIIGHNLGSVVFMWGLMITQMQMLLDPSDSHLASAPIGYRYGWRLGWTVVYLLINFGLFYSAILDPSRMGELESVTSWSVEFIAWRVILLVMVGPVLGISFAVYANVCCEGDWVLG